MFPELSSFFLFNDAFSEPVGRAAQASGVRNHRIKPIDTYAMYMGKSPEGGCFHGNSPQAATAGFRPEGGD